MDFNFLDELDRYHGGQMSEQERKDFEQRVQEDAGLQREFDVYAVLLQGLDGWGETDARQQLQRIREKLRQERYFDSFNQPKHIQMNNSVSRRGWMAAAAVLILAIAAVVFYTKQNTISREEAYARFYKPESRVLGQTLDELGKAGFADPAAPGADSLARALKAYEDLNFDQALVQLRQYLQNHPEDELAQMYLGLTHLQRSEYATAISLLDPLANNDRFTHQNVARWYLALSLTQANNGDALNQAKVWFERLKSDPQSGYSREAASIIDLLGL